MASSAILQDPSWVLLPSSNLVQFSDNLYKIVHFRNPLRRVKGSQEVDRFRKGNERKTDQAISRAKRVVLENALCNDWDWFATFTLNPEKYDRYNLDKFYKDFSQWIRDQRKKTGCKIKYLLIPEAHKDGAWHMHGLLRGVPDTVSFRTLRRQGFFVPNKLVWNDYYNWLGFADKFGYCSLGRIRNAEGAGFYVTKYIGKSLQDSNIQVGRHLYYASIGLSRPLLRGEVYGESAWLDQFTVNHYDFCDTGLARADRGFDWDYAQDMCESAALAPFFFDQMDEAAQTYIEQHQEFWQMGFEDLDAWEGGNYAQEYPRPAESALALLPD